jgi:putative transposase
MCQILNVSRSGYYAWISIPESHRKRLNRDLLERIKKIHRVSRETYGSPRITKAQNNEGIKCGKNRVSKLMKENIIAAKTKRKFKATTNSKHSYPEAPNILSQDFKATKPNQVSVADITYIPTDEG